MKALTLLLALLVTTLSLLPCCPQEDCSDDAVATQQAGHHEEEASACSPFYSCAACSGFTLPDVQAPEAPRCPTQSPAVAAYQPSPLPQLHYAIWQPPQLREGLRA